MTPRDALPVPGDDFDRLLAAWFEADAPVRAPEAVADVAIARTVSAPQRPRWLPFGRWPAMQTALRFPSFAAVPRLAWLLLVLALIVAIAALGVALVGGHKLPAPFGPASTGLLAFDGDGDIYVANVDGSNRHAITSGSAVDSAPVWSLDGEHLAYFSKASADAGQLSIVIVDASGAHPWVVATIDTWTFSSVSWSPDGHRLAYIDHVLPSAAGWPDAGDLAIADLTNRTTATITHGLRASEPAWAPDGMQVAFKVIDLSTATSQLDLVGVDGSNPHRLSTVESNNAGFDAAQWSPDGKRLLVWAGTDTHDVFVIDAASGRATNLTNTAAGDEFWATWSNDGTRIAYEALADPPGPIDVLHVMAADGSNDRVLGNAQITGATLLWSPDDKFILGFDSDGTSSNEAFLIPVDGFTPATAIRAPANSLTATWQRR